MKRTSPIALIALSHKHEEISVKPKTYILGCPPSQSVRIVEGKGYLFLGPSSDGVTNNWGQGGTTQRIHLKTCQSQDVKAGR